jgi:hypothetical protein
VDVGQLLNDLCVRLGYCLTPDDQQRIISDPPASVDEFTDTVVTAEGFDPVLMATEQRQQVRRIVAAAFGEPLRPSGPPGVVADSRSTARPHSDSGN